VVTRVVTVDGVGDVDALLRSMSKRASNWQVLAPRIHDFILVREEQLFATGGASEGKAWAGYGAEPKYKAWKQAVLGDLTVLRWKGGKAERLYPSLVDPRSPHHVFRKGSDGVTVGTSLPYADRLHRGGKNMFGEAFPARPLVGLGARSTGRLAQLITLYVARGESRGNEWST